MKRGRVIGGGRLDDSWWCQNPMASRSSRTVPRPGRGSALRTRRRLIALQSLAAVADARELLDHRQRPAQPGGSARQRHRDGVRVRRRRRADQAHLGRAQPREAPPLDDELTRVSIPSGPLRADSRAKDQVNESPNRQDRRDPAHGGIGSPPAQADFRWHGDRRVPAPGHGGGHGWTRTRPGRPLGASGPWPAGSHPSRW
jgi:hypothetical protein